jgi:hypothetical protein
MSTTTPASGPKKDVIYVDIEDDITSIIDKVKHADASIVALVPPKRIGVLQSVVNLKLLQRAADGVNKRVVMITSDASLTALAAGAMIPVARNLQSKPEIPEQSTFEQDDEEVITGEEVSGGDNNDTDDAPLVVAPIAASAAASKAKARRRGGPTVPNFDNFRNKTALIAGGVLALILFFVWAFIFAPKAVVTIAAKTTPYSVNKAITATPNGALSVESGTLGAVSKELAKTASVDFQATGKKDVGEKATGGVKFTNNSSSAATINAGTELTTSGGLEFVLDATVSVPAATLSFSCPNYLCPSSANGSVTASTPGTKYNAASGSLSGGPSNVSAVFSAPTTGGTDKTITVVSEQDAATAREKLTSQNADAMKAELKKQFSNDIMVVDESFATTPGNPTVAPAVGQEASTAKLSVETKYSMLGLKRTDVAAIIEQDLKKQLSGIPNQQIYDKGTDSVRFTNVSRDGDNFKLSLQTTGYIGPKIDTAKLAEQLAGKREGEIIAKVKTYDGIENVTVNFSPFWVSKAPSADKVIIKFQINNVKN